MNKKGRIYRTLAAAKHAFLEKPPKIQPVNRAEENAMPTKVEDPVTVADLKSENCTGCGACFNLCPTKAITMSYNYEGFLEPVVDSEKCVKCKKCITACPALHPVYDKLKRPKCYAAFGEDDIRSKSSSGAIFSLVSSYVFENGGYVCGAAYDDRFVLKHILISGEDEMYRLRESKYVQTDTNTVYTQIGELLSNDTMVLFCGCGCQVAGLYAYLSSKKISQSKLYTIDLMCHGSPSPKLFEKYINEVHGGADNIESISFRSKEFFGWSNEMNVKYKNGSVYRNTRNMDPYYKAFLPCISVRKSCGHCVFAKLPRQGDLTLADFWGVRELNKSYDDGNGTSIVSVNSQKGEKLMEAISEKLKLYEEVDINYILTHGQPFDHSFKTHPAHDLYFKYLALGADVYKAYDYAVERKFDVGIMGVWYGCNYGSVVTYFTLHEIISDMGLSVLMIDKPNVCKNDSENGNTHSRRFAAEHYDMSRRYDLHELKQLNRNVDTFVMGCDQVWNRGISRNFGMANYFDFVDDDKKKISYASSFGHNKDYASERDRVVIRQYFDRFDSISVREADGVKICKEVYGVNAKQVIDPVFLYDKTKYALLYNKSAAAKRTDLPDKYICTYILDPTQEIKDAIAWISEKTGMKVINMLDGFPWMFDINVEKMAGCTGEIVKDVQVEDWLYYIANCEMLITDSCHGTSFAIIFEKLFICIGNKGRGLSRFESLLGMFDLMDRVFLDPKEIINNDKVFESIDFKRLGDIIEREKKSSLEWLKNALFSPKKYRSHRAYAVYDERMEDKK